MSRIIYTNGRYLPAHEATVSVEDRGYLFSDGVYEVAALIGGRLLDWEGHLTRLERSLRALEIRMPVSRAALDIIVHEVIRRNAVVDGIVYIQITRGAARRNHAFPPAHVKPGLMVSASRASFPDGALLDKGVDVITAPDQRWARRDIKSVSLLPNVLAKEQAVRAKAREAWLVDGQGIVTEGSSANAYIVGAKGEIITHPATERILGGITRDTVLRLARADGVKVLERPFTLSEALKAKEAFLTSTTSLLMPVVRIDGKKIGNGTPGAVTRRLRARYETYIRDGQVSVAPRRRA